VTFADRTAAVRTCHRIPHAAIGGSSGARRRARVAGFLVRVMLSRWVIAPPRRSRTQAGADHSDSRGAAPRAGTIAPFRSRSGTTGPAISSTSVPTRNELEEFLLLYRALPPDRQTEAEAYIEALLARRDGQEPH